MADAILMERAKKVRWKTLKLLETVDEPMAEDEAGHQGEIPLLKKLYALNK